MDNKYKYTYEKTADYCYKGTDVLINKLNITNDEDLFNAERELVSLRTYELNEKPLKGNFDFKHLKDIHKYLFQDVYRWAGDIRNCNIAKQDLFCLTEHIESFGNDVFNKLKKEKFFVGYDNQVTLDKLVELFADINALHPFREGNGRSQREFIEELAKINGIDLDLTQVPKMDMIIASHEAINGHTDKLHKLFISNVEVLSKEEQLYFINLYCSKKMAKEIMEFLN
jgi:cell filamentation protein